jgi:hypothetical protein
MLKKSNKKIVGLKDSINNDENNSIFSNPSQNELENLQKSDTVAIQNVNDIFKDLPLREYCIKASYNTALTGNYVSLDMIKYVINRGCRFLDFEVFYIGEITIDEKGVSKTNYTARVAYSTDNTFTTINTENSLLFDDVLTTVINFSFSNPTPNVKDPMFINLRIKSNNTDIYKYIASSLNNVIRSKIYCDMTSEQTPPPAIKIDNDTILSDIMGKIIVCVDRTIVRNYKDYTDCDGKTPNCYDLDDYTNIETGSEVLNLLRYNEVMDQCSIPINIANDNLTTDVKTMKYVVPNTKNDNSANPNYNEFVLKHSCQDVAYRFYKRDYELDLYETFFNDNYSALVPLSVALTYFKNMND